jgi:predicted ATPase
VTAIERHILTGTPGSGKTSIVRLGFAGISHPGRVGHGGHRGRAGRRVRPAVLPASFIDLVVAAQRQAREAALEIGVRFHDPSPTGTHRLATWLSLPIPAALSGELDTMANERPYHPKVFFIRNLGVCQPTSAHV